MVIFLSYATFCFSWICKCFFFICFVFCVNLCLILFICYVKFVTWLSVLFSSCPYSPIGPLPGPFFLLEISLWNGCFFSPAAHLSSRDCLHPYSVFNSLFSGSFAYCSLLVTLLYPIAFKKNTLDIIVKMLSSLKVFTWALVLFGWGIEC